MNLSCNSIGPEDSPRCTGAHDQGQVACPFLRLVADEDGWTRMSEERMLSGS